MALTDLTLPSSSTPLTTQKTSLEGTPFQFRFDWNSRSERWTFSLYTDEGTPLLNGACLVADIDLLRCVSDDLRPGGVLRIVDFIEPTIDTIGDVNCVYYPSTDL